MVTVLTPPVNRLPTSVPERRLLPRSPEAPRLPRPAVEVPTRLPSEHGVLAWLGRLLRTVIGVALAAIGIVLALFALVPAVFAALLLLLVGLAPFLVAAFGILLTEGVEVPADAVDGGHAGR